MNYINRYPRYLNEVLRSIDLSKVPAETTMALWDSLHHLDSQAASKTISDLQFKRMQERLEQAPSFLFPTHSPDKSQLILLSEIQEENLIAFSNIVDEDSSPLFLVRFFHELAEDKSIVPMRGDIVDQGLLKPDIQHVLHNFVKFYLETDLFESYVKVFNQNFEKFNYEDYASIYLKLMQNREIV